MSEAATDSDDVAPEQNAAPKTARKPRGTRKSTATATVDVDALLDGMATLARTVETLTHKVEVSRELVEAIDRVPEAKRTKVDATPTEEPTTNRLRDVAVDFVRTLGYAAGIGLVAAAAGGEIGLRTPIFASLGVIAFLVSTFLTPSESTSSGLLGQLRRAGLAILTVAGLGLAIGGIQYFGDAPERAAKLIPIGLAIFATAFMLRGKYRLASEQLVWVAGAGIWICLLMSIGLGQFAHSSDDKTEEPAPVVGEHGSTTTVTPGAPAAGSDATDDHGSTATTAAPDAAHGSDSGHDSAATHAAPTAADSHQEKASSGH